MKQFVMIFLLLIVLFILITRRQAPYKPDQVSKLRSWSLFSSEQGGGGINDLCDIILAQLGGGNSKDKINSLLGFVESYSTSHGHPIPLAPYKTEDEVNQMFTQAYSQGETGMNVRDRILLRLIAGPCVAIMNEGGMSMLLGNWSYTNDGKPDFADAIVNDSQKTPREVLVFGFTILKALYGESGSSTPPTQEYLRSRMGAILPMINDILPSKYTKYSTPDELFQEPKTAWTDLTAQQQARLRYWARAYTTGALYIAWLAENKWKLDADWDPVTSPASSP